MRSRGFTLAEVAVASAVVGLLLVASLTVVGGSATGQAKSADMERGCLLARDMLAEVTAQAYEDPDAPGWGPESGEMGAFRTRFDDVDDYAGLVESPPINRDGSAIVGVDGWTRTTSVDFVAPNNPEEGAGIDRGVKRIVVTVYRNKTMMARLTTVRSRGHDRLCE